MCLYARWLAHVEALIYKEQASPTDMQPWIRLALAEVC